MLSRPIVAAIVVAIVSEAHAEATPSLQLVSGGELLALVRGAAVAIHAADGRPLYRLGAGERDDPLPGRRPVDARERSFDLLGVPESERDTQAAEDLLEAEATLAERRAAVPEDDPREEAGPPALAAPVAAGLVVIAGGGAYRVTGAGAPVRLGTVPAGATALAATGPGGRLWLARGRELLTSEDGAAWTAVAREELPIAHLVGSPRGWLAWASGDTLTIARVTAGAPGSEVGRGSARTFRVPARLRSLAACEEDLLILADDGLHLAENVPRSLDGPRRVAGPLAGERLACGPDRQAPWLVAGPGLLASSDRGQTWRPRADAPAVALAGASFTSGRLWLLSRTGALLALPLAESAPTVSAGWRAAADSEDPPRPPRPSAWSTFLPRLVLTASHVEQGPRREQRLLAFAEFPLQPSPPPAPLPPGPGPSTWAGPALPPGPDPRCLPAIRARAVDRALADPARARSLVTRAGRSAWLPELRVRMERRLGRNESLDVKPAVTGDALGLDTVDDVRYEVRATWDLPRLVFNPEEVVAHHQALRTAEMRRDIESLVNRIFFERRRLALPPASALSPAEAGERLLRLEELAAELDAVSGGAFSRCGSAPEPAAGP